MRNLVLQVSVPSGGQRSGMLGYDDALYRHSQQSVLRYAQKIGADYLCVGARTFADRGLHPTYERFQAFQARFDDYDYIAYVDCDALIKLSAPDIFQAYKESPFAAFPEGAAMHGNLLPEIDPHIGLQPMEHLLKWRIDKGHEDAEIRLLSRYWVENQYFNAGIFVASRAMRIQVRSLGIDRYLCQWPLNDQTALNKALFDARIRISNLSFRFNSLLHLYPESTLPDVLEQSYVIHFAARTKSLYAALTASFGPDWDLVDHRAEEFRAVSMSLDYNSPNLTPK